MGARKDTLGQIGKDGLFLHIECRGCGHSAYFVASELASIVGTHRAPREVRFACSNCGKRDFIPRVVGSDVFYGPTPKVLWRPTIIRAKR
jgi:ribosomal protein L37E